MLFDTQRTVKIADFGLSAQFGGSKLSALCGGLALTTAPRGLGVALDHVPAGPLPFEGEDPRQLPQRDPSGQDQLLPDRQASLLDVKASSRN